MKTYTVTAEQDGKYWHLRVPEINRSTQARRVNEVDPMARDLIAIMTGTEPASFEISVEWGLPAAAEGHFKRATALRERAALANAECGLEARRGAKARHEAGLSVREIGKVLGLSFQGAHQLVSEDVSEPATAQYVANQNRAEPGICPSCPCGHTAGRGECQVRD